MTTNQDFTATLVQDYLDITELGTELMEDYELEAAVKAINWWLDSEELTEDEYEDMLTSLRRVEDEIEYREEREEL